MNEPPRDARWSDGTDPEPPAELSGLLRSGRAPLGTSDEVAELSRRLSAVLGPASGLPGGEPPVPGSGARPVAERAPGVTNAGVASAGRGLWTLGGVGAAIAIGAAAWVLAGGPREPRVERPSEPVLERPSESGALSSPPGDSPVEPAVEAVAEPPLPAAPAESAAEAPAPAAPAPAPPASASAPHASDEPPAPPAASTAAPRAKPRSAALRSARDDASAETALLEQARAALRERPAHALELTRRHRARFPEGLLAQEREVIAIEALERLGRSEAARARAEAFERRYRGSVHQPRLERGADTSAPAGGALNTAPP